MKKSVFFSVGGAEDLHLAEAVKKLLPDNIIYLYTKTGEEATSINSEIDKAINSCKIFVVFWSEDYLKSIHCQIELAKFKKICNTNKDQERDIIILPCKTEHPNIQSKWKNPITQLDEFVFGQWRDNRAIEAAPDAARVKEVILKKLNQLQPTTEILIPRGQLIDQLYQASLADEINSREVIFVTGHDGHGRRTLITQFMRGTYGEKVERRVTLDVMQGPEDLVIALMEAKGVPKSVREETLEKLNQGALSATKIAREILHAGRDDNSYYIISFDRNTGLDLFHVPDWVYSILSVFQKGNAPLIFIVAASGAVNESASRLPQSTKITVPSLEDKEIERLVHLLALRDILPERWTSESKRYVAQASGHNPSLCKMIMRTAVTENSLDFLQEIAERATNSFAQGLSAAINYCTNKYKNKAGVLTALAVVEKIGLTSNRALNEILAPLLNGEEIDIYQLREDGLVEQLSDGLLRIPPLIQRRLGSSLWGSIDNSEIDRLFQSFSSKFLISHDDYGPIYSSNIVSVASRSGKAIPAALDKYVTTATLFKAGLDSYSEKNFKQAHSILLRAFERLKGESSLDLSTQLEVARYTGLACARQNDEHNLNQVYSFLFQRFEGSKKKKQANGMIHFIRGFYARRNNVWQTAINELNAALSTLKDISHTQRQRAAIFTELSYVYMEKTIPDYEQAKAYSERAHHEIDVTHTLNAYIKARILHSFREVNWHSESDREREIDAIKMLIDDLASRLKGTNFSFHTERRDDLWRECSSR